MVLPAIIGAGGALIGGLFGGSSRPSSRQASTQRMLEDFQNTLNSTTNRSIQELSKQSAEEKARSQEIYDRITGGNLDQARSQFNAEQYFRDLTQGVADRTISPSEAREQFLARTADLGIGQGYKMNGERFLGDYMAGFDKQSREMAKPNWDADISNISQQLLGRPTTAAEKEGVYSFGKGMTPEQATEIMSNTFEFRRRNLPEFNTAMKALEGPQIAYRTSDDWKPAQLSALNEPVTV